MSAFTPLLQAWDSAPWTQRAKVQGLKSGDGLIKDALPLTTWIAVGTLTGAALILTLGRISILIPAVFLIGKLVNALLIVYGFKESPWMKNVILEKFSAQYPTEDGSYGPKPSQNSVVVFMIGARSNHPFGIFGTDFKRLGDYFNAMNKQIEEHREEYGLLANTAWIGDERDSANEVMNLMYFKNEEGLHKFAHDALHLEAWQWWNKTYSKHDHISIWHETYVVPAGHYESIYVNSHPTLLSGGAITAKTEQGTKYLSPIVDARRGALRSSRGRLSMGRGDENEKIDAIAGF